MDPEDQALLVKEMRRPVDVDTLVNSPDIPEIVAEIYIASLLAIDADTAAQNVYLTMLATR